MFVVDSVLLFCRVRGGFGGVVLVTFVVASVLTTFIVFVVDSVLSFLLCL